MTATQRINSCQFRSSCRVNPKTSKMQAKKKSNKKKRLYSKNAPSISTIFSRHPPYSPQWMPISLTILLPYTTHVLSTFFIIVIIVIITLSFPFTIFNTTLSIYGDFSRHFLPFFPYYFSDNKTLINIYDNDNDCTIISQKSFVFIG